MRQAGELAQFAEHRRERQFERFAEGQGRQRIGRVVAAGKLELAQGQEPFPAARQPQRSGVRSQDVVRAAGGMEREAQAPPGQARHRRDQRIVGVEHGGAAAPEDARLRGGVIGDRVVAIEVIGRYVQHRGGLERERFGRIELVARQLQDVELRARVEQLERRLAEVPADARAPAGALRHAAEQGRDRALAVGAGDADDRSARRAREQLDVTDERQALRARRIEERPLRRHAGRQHDVLGARQPLRVQAAGAHEDLGCLGAQRRERGRRLAGVEHGDRQAARAQVPHDREAGLAEADDERVGHDCGGVAHRSFSVARPASTSSTLMIQKRTMILGSAQPLSSK